MDLLNEIGIKRGKGMRKERGKPIPTDPIEYDRIVACIKKRVGRWPSAYASGMVVTSYKRAMDKKGLDPYTTFRHPRSSDLDRWFKEKWIDLKTGKPCGSIKTTRQEYPTCRPTIKISNKTPVLASQLSSAEKGSMIRQKQIARGKMVHYSETRNQRPNINHKRSKTSD